jgi:hypothetical protein
MLESGTGGASVITVVSVDFNPVWESAITRVSWELCVLVGEWANCLESLMGSAWRQAEIRSLAMS